MGSVSAERVGQGEMSGVTRRVVSLAEWCHSQGGVHMVAAGGPPLALTAWTGLENPTATLQWAHFWQKRVVGL